jgi:hypothetical protein
VESHQLTLLLIVLHLEAFLVHCHPQAFCVDLVVILPQGSTLLFGRLDLVAQSIVLEQSFSERTIIALLFELVDYSITARQLLFKLTDLVS